MDERLVENPNTEVREKIEQQGKQDEFNAFLAAVKESLDKTFAELGYVCFVFDKKNPSNQYVANISNVAVEGFISKLFPFLVNWRRGMKKTQKNLRKRLGRVI